MNDQTAVEQANALHQSISRLKQIATAFAPAFIELARGAHTGHIQPNRPGLQAVSRLLGTILVTEAQVRVLKKIMIAEGFCDPKGFDLALTVEVEQTAIALAEEINRQEAGLLSTFEFQPVPNLKVAEVPA